MKSPSILVEPAVGDGEPPTAGASLAPVAVYGLLGLTIGVLVMLVLGFRRRRSAVRVRAPDVDFPLPLPAATRPGSPERTGAIPAVWRPSPASVPARFPWASAVTAFLRQAPRVRILPRSRVRLTAPAARSVRGRACRLCGLRLDEGDHTTCQQGVLDG